MTSIKYFKMRKLVAICLMVSFIFPFSDIFTTSLGECYIYGEDVHRDLKLKSYIRQKSDELISEFGVVEKRNFSIKIVNKPESIKSNFPDWASGIAFDDKIIIDSSKALIPSKLFQIIAHELCHIYQHRIKKKYSFPAWFKEGMAMYFAKEFFSQKSGLTTSNTFLDYYVQLQHLKSMSKLKNSDKVRSAYKQSLIAYSDILKKYNSSSIKKILNEMNSGILFDEAFQNVLGVSLYDFESQVNKKIKSSNKRSIFLRFPSFIIFISSMIIFIAFIFVRKRNKRIIKKWDIEEKIELEIEKLNKELSESENGGVP